MKRSGCTPFSAIRIRDFLPRSASAPGRRPGRSRRRPGPACGSNRRPTSRRSPSACVTRALRCLPCQSDVPLHALERCWLAGPCAPIGEARTDCRHHRGRRSSGAGLSRCTVGRQLCRAARRPPRLARTHRVSQGRCPLRRRRYVGDASRGRGRQSDCRAVRADLSTAMGSMARGRLVRNLAGCRTGPAAGQRPADADVHLARLRAVSRQPLGMPRRFDGGQVLAVAEEALADVTPNLRKRA